MVRGFPKDVTKEEVGVMNCVSHVGQSHPTVGYAFFSSNVSERLRSS